MRRGLVAVAVVACVALAGAQQPAAQNPLDQMSFMVGKWEGDGWMMVPGAGKVAFRGYEQVERKLQGKALLVEGHFTAKVGPEQQERVVHEALSVLFYEPKAKQFRFRTHTLRGGAGDHELKLTGEKAWEWTLEPPDGSKVRYRTTFAGGDWHEVGERSTDGGQTWTQFIEMRLKKVS